MTDVHVLQGGSDDQVPDPSRRQLLNLITFAAVTGVVGGALYPALRFFPGERSLVRGLRGDPTCLIVSGDEALGCYGINAICTHLGCVVRGPAPLSLALTHVQVDNDRVLLSAWRESDFRDGSRSWWA